MVAPENVLIELASEERRKRNSRQQAGARWCRLFLVWSGRVVGGCHIILNENGKMVETSTSPPLRTKKKSTPARVWCLEFRFRLSWLGSSIKTISGTAISSRFLLRQQPVKVNRCGLQWSLFRTKKRAVPVLVSDCEF